jgi:hypothetical protein
MARTARSLYQTSQRNTASIIFDDMSGGLCTVRHGLELKLNELEEILNMKYVRTDKVAAILREGLKKQTTTAAAGYAIKDLGLYVDASANEYILGVYNSTLAKIASGGWTAIATLAGTRGRMIQFANKMIIADGSYLKQFNGTALNLCYDHGNPILDSIAGYASSTKLYTGSVTRAGHKFTTPSWDAGYTIPPTKATFWLSKVGTPTGTLICRVRKVSDDSVIATSATMTATDLESAGQEETFDLTASANMATGTAYYITIEYSDAGSDVSNCIQVHYTSGTTASGNYVTFNVTYSDVAGDCYLKFYPGLPPKASMLEVRYNRLYCDDKTTGQENWLHASNVNDPNQWSGTGTYYIICEQGTEITCIKNFYDVLLIHMGGDGYKSVLRLTGTAPGETAIAILVNGVAAVNPDCACNIGNDFLFLSDSGVISLGAWQSYGDLEQSIVSDKVANLVNANVSTARFGGMCTTEQQYWQEYGESGGMFLVFDAELRIWTQYRFELGSGVLPTCFAEWGGDTYVGDAAGHLWKMDIKTPIYYDGVITNEYPACIKFAWSDFNTNLQKHFRFINSQVYSRLGATYSLKLYKDLAADAFWEKSIGVPFAPDLLTVDATMLTSDADFPTGAANSTYKTYRPNFRCKSVQIGIEDINPSTSPVLIQRATLDGAITGRY